MSKLLSLLEEKIMSGELSGLTVFRSSNKSGKLMVSIKTDAESFRVNYANTIEDGIAQGMGSRGKRISLNPSKKRARSDLI
jgi:hypothetical protein